MAHSIRIRVKLVGDRAEIRALLDHPMETGLRKDPATEQLVPLHFIKNVVVTINGIVVLETEWAQAIARNPYLQFRVRGAKPGDSVSIEWEDNLGERGQASATVPAEGT